MFLTNFFTTVREHFLTYLLSHYVRVSSTSEFTHSLSCQPTRTFKPHTRAISALAIKVGKVTGFCFNYNYKYTYNLKFSIAITITIIQAQVIVIQLQFQLQLQSKDSQNIVTNSLTHEVSSFAYVDPEDLFCISIPDLLKPHFSLSLFFHRSLLDFNFCNT